jgi:phage terminase small subunit
MGRVNRPRTISGITMSKLKPLKLTAEQVELASKLTSLQRKFVIELIKPKTSQRQAYLTAGGKAKTESAQDAASSTMLSNVKVRAFHDSLIGSKMVSSIMERDEALAILSTNARVKMTDVADYKFVEVGRDKDGQPIMQTVWTMKDSKDIDPNVISCIKSVTMTKQGPKIELHDQQGAIKQLSSLQGWDAPKRTELTGAGGEALQLNANVSAPEIASALASLMGKL